MKVKALVAFRAKLFKPCRKLLLLFKIKLKKPIFIRSLQHRLRHKKLRKATPRNQMFSTLQSAFHSLKQSRKVDRLGDLGSVSEAERERMLFPSPITPASSRKVKKDDPNGPIVDEEVEDACRSFENYLVDMIVEEGRVTDLTDVEELLYCWKNLKSPAFINLVCRFYGELCKDLFSPEEENTDVNSS
ncbi:hypothetical protein Tsubulata_025755 [Turnera subulata]|uniref:OVATE domain-containing protein n=1 Tax=Turnera subulata TaxID=218843 RepID=A0A9Q0JMB6_9ROSI|nr:hypothetical protein Tsubulata_025755 [Turnera subulata]